jgi:hypothetical protein
MYDASGATAMSSEVPDCPYRHVLPVIDSKFPENRIRRGQGHRRGLRLKLQVNSSPTAMRYVCVVLCSILSIVTDRK